MNAALGSYDHFFSCRWLSRRAAFRFLFVVFLALHAAKVLRLVPLDMFGNGRAPIEQLHSAAFTDIVRDREAPSRGYDPYIAGSIRSGLGMAPSSTLPVLFDRLIRWAVSPVLSCKLFVFTAIFTGPLLLFFAARAFQLRRVVSLLAAVIVSAGFLSYDEVSERLIYGGYLSFWFGSFVAILNAGCLYGWAVTARRRFAVGFVLSSILLPEADPVFLVPQIVAWTALLVVIDGPARWKALQLLLTGVAASTAANFSWAHSYLGARFVSVPLDPWAPEGRRGLIELWVPGIGNWQAWLNSLSRTYLAVFAVTGLCRGFPGNVRVAKILAIWALGLIPLAFFPAPFGLSTASDWGRLSFLLTTLLVIPASVFSAEVFLKPHSVRILLFAWYLWFSLTWQVMNRYNPRPLADDLRPAAQHLLLDLRGIPPEGRVLVQFEDQFSEGLRLASIERRHVFTGIPIPVSIHSSGPAATFTRAGETWILYGKPLASYRNGDLADLFQRNNLRYVIAVTPGVHQFFLRKADFEEIPSTGQGAYWIHRFKGDSAEVRLGR